ncbi:MAG: YdeI/OmpD-associated family protein [Bacteroidota bacterium]
MNPKIDDYLLKAERWQKELEALRNIILDCGLHEELKWAVPCYTFHGSNVVIIGELKDCAVLSFFKGALLQDAHGILVKPGENTQGARTAKFTSVKEITDLEPVIKAYIFEAIALEDIGLKVDFKEKAELVFPDELQNKFNELPAFKAAFNALSPGRQRAYNLYFSAPKQSKTRESRIEKYVEQIMEGRGFNE